MRCEWSLNLGPVIYFSRIYKHEYIYKYVCMEYMYCMCWAISQMCLCFRFLARHGYLSQAEQAVMPSEHYICNIVGGAFLVHGAASAKKFQVGFKGTVPRNFRLQVFFMNQRPPSPWVSQKGRFKFFLKFAEIFATQGAPPVSLTSVANRKSLQTEKF